MKREPVDAVTKIINNLCDSVELGDMNFSLLLELYEKQREVYPLLLKMEKQVLNDFNNKKYSKKKAVEDIYDSYDKLANQMSMKRGLMDLSDRLMLIENHILATIELLGYSTYRLQYSDTGKPTIVEVKGEHSDKLTKALGFNNKG